VESQSDGMIAGPASHKVLSRSLDWLITCSNEHQMVEVRGQSRGRNDAELQALLDNRQQPYYEHEVVAA
jgi:hypothetical protein